MTNGPVHVTNQPTHLTYTCTDITPTQVDNRTTMQTIAAINTRRWSTDNR